MVASTPGHASEILQGLERPAIGTTTTVAAADPQVPNAPAASEPATAAAPVTEPAAAAPVMEQAVTPEPAAPAPEVAATTPVVEAPVAETPPVSADKSKTAVTTADPVVPVNPAPAAVLANVPPTIDAIEIEGDKSFFAGGGPEGAVMRLYIDGKYIADATVADGRWLVEAGKVLTQPNQRIRIDMLQPGTAEVAARAEVDFQMEIAAEQPTAVAETEAAQSVAGKTAPAISTEATSASGVPSAADSNAAPLDVTGDAVASPATGEDSSGATGSQAVPPEPTTPEPATAPDAVAEAETPEPTVAEPAVADDVPTMVAVAVGDPEMARFASGKAIIRRGDNLWTIARRVYGAGIKYTTIYEANTGQIRNPNRIYPGQVFELPDNAN